MNELIERLAREAGIEVLHDGMNDWALIALPSDLRRFAALVAEECVNSIESTPKPFTTAGIIERARAVQSIREKFKAEQPKEPK